ncbi:MAG: hypothetical protein JWR37_6048, partial [Mycobacterium sp.]|nr:hypothetical protein [Mycobacterium sp.]
GTRLGALQIAVRAFRRGRPGPAAVVAAAGLLMLPRGAPIAFLRSRAAWMRACKRMLGGRG